MNGFSLLCLYVELSNPVPSICDAPLLLLGLCFGSFTSHMWCRALCLVLTRFLLTFFFMKHLFYEEKVWCGIHITFLQDTVTLTCELKKSRRITHELVTVCLFFCLWVCEISKTCDKMHRALHLFSANVFVFYVLDEDFF